MKTQIGKNIKLGVFVALGTLFFIIGIYFVGKKQNLFDTTFRISAVFKDVSGLQPGNNVRFAGINVGIIENIQIVNDTSIRVDMQIQEKVHKFIKDDSQAIIGSEGIMGNKILIITPGSTGKVIKNDAFVATTAPVNMDDIMKNLKVTIENAALLTADLSEITYSIRSGKGTIGKLFMDSTFAEEIDKTVGNIKEGTGDFQENMEAAKSNVLFRGYFRRKAKEKEREAKEAEEAKQQVKESKSKK
jgi:phospholipid/cholesterol/gamma-HCH transport system substrate-binding protein